VAYKAWTRVGDAEHGSRFRLAKAMYKRKLRRAKEKSWSEFKLTSSSTDTLAALAQLRAKQSLFPYQLLFLSTVVPLLILFKSQTHSLIISFQSHLSPTAHM
jgi:hypothetical protein